MHNEAINIGPSSFSGCPRLKQITVCEENPNFKAIDGILYTEAVDTLICSRKDIKIVTIPETVNHIVYDAFQYCQELSSVSIPQCVESIGSFAFNGCTKLKSVYFPKSYVVIGQWMFKDCDNLKEIYLQLSNPAEVSGILYSGIKKGQCTFYVPKGSGRQYEEYMFNWRKDSKHDYKEIPWGEFSKIVEYDYK